MAAAPSHSTNWKCLIEYLLEMDVITTTGGGEPVWNKIIFNGWIDLYDIASLTTDIQIMNFF